MIAKNYLVIGVPDILNFLVDKKLVNLHVLVIIWVVAASHDISHFLFKYLVEFIFEQNFGGISKWHFFVETIELDVWSPGQEDQEEPSRQKNKQDGRATL